MMCCGESCVQRSFRSRQSRGRGEGRVGSAGVCSAFFMLMTVSVHNFHCILSCSSPHILSLSFSLIENLSKTLLVLTIVIKESKIRIRLTMLVAK